MAGATVVDGTGAPGYVADVGVAGDRIAAVGDLSSAPRARTIEAKDRVVAPGFIDVHAHSELALGRTDDGFGPVRMGVTTQLSAPDGFGWAPLPEARFAEMAQYLEVFYGSAGADLGGGDLDGFLRRLGSHLPGNVALQVPHASVRLAVLGWEPRVATDEELAQMQAIVRRWVERGAVALSTGLEYEPARRADTRELVALALAAREGGAIYVAHQRGYGEAVGAGLDETLAVARGAHTPVHVSHLTVDADVARRLAAAEDEGIEITFDKYPYTAGSTHLASLLPFWAQVGPPADVLARLDELGADDAFLRHLETTSDADRPRFATANLAEPSGWEGKTLREVCTELGMAVGPGIVEILRRTRLRALMVYHGNDGGLESAIHETYRHRRHMVASDGIYHGARPHPRAFGTFPRVLGRLVREQKVLSLETAVHKMTGQPASTFGLKGRGHLREGAFADLVVFDPATVQDLGTYDEPRKGVIGIDYVIVNGGVAIDAGALVDRERGRLLAQS